PPVTAGDLPDSGEASDPVDTLTGELMLDPEVDLDLGGPLPVRFERLYASSREVDSAPGVLGRNWRHNFEWSIERDTATAKVISPSGMRTRFVYASGAWSAEAGQAFAPQLAEAADHSMVFFDPLDELFRGFDPAGRLVSVSDRNGNTLSLAL